jgi:uncharacterized SAM-binding protein YcdF (DUF218 family)
MTSNKFMESPHLPESQKIQKKRVLVYLGARLGPENKSNKTDQATFPLVTPNIKQNTMLPVEVSGGYVRQEAINQIYHNKPKNEEILIVTTGGNEPDGRSRAYEAAKRLNTQYGIEEQNIVSLSSQGSTFGNAKRVIEELINRSEEIGTLKSVEIVTNDFHMLRSWLIFSITVLAMESDKDLTVSNEDKELIFSLIDSYLAESRSNKEVREAIIQILLPYFAENTIKVTPLISEEVLEETTDPALQRYARAVKNNSWVKESLKLEYQGVKDILNKIYRT